MRLKHYHVLVGLPGCMPDSNDACRTLAEAQDSAQWWADEYRNDWDCANDRSHYKVVGNKRDGYTAIRRYQSDHTLPTSIRVNVCFEEDCLEELEEATMD